MRISPIATLFLVPVLLLASFPAGGTGSPSPSEAALEAARLKIAEEFSRIDLELKRAAGRLGESGLTGYDARSALEDLFNAFPYAIDCAAVDPSGTMVTIEPAPFRHHEGKDIGGQDQVKRMLNRREPVLSGVFLTVEGIEAADVEYPVTSPDGMFLGAVSLLFSPEKLLTGVLEPAAGEKPAEVCVIEPGGRVLYHPEADAIGTNLYASDKWKTDACFSRLGERLAEQWDGRDEPAGLEWATVELYDGFWRVLIGDASLNPLIN